ncbi:signal transduction histidine kinase [Acidovorax soli]|uniref:histidine kinase n=1 Tax=Acidovorax soli TaxID=592050 RepID=A0A7X0UBA4_9BURK|nr:response regulator [Acidovorax soli]MBB6562142.1 signal transduction histidine kinase [Acidovorax soli]
MFPATPDLPVPPAPAVAPEAALAAGEGGGSGPVKILVVDDEPSNLAVMEAVFQDSGYTLVHASSGSEALMALMNHEFAVLVLDVNMPDMTGFELAQLIKQRKKTAHVPIIFLTAYFNDDQHVVEGYGSGAVDYLHKPFNVGVLRSKVAIFADLYRKTLALEQVNQALVQQVAERATAQEQLRLLNETLERRVQERTHALQLRDAQLREADRRKDEFLATLAHELRNPLAPVAYALRLLRLKGASQPHVERSADLIDRQVKAMSRLIDDLMDVSRINQGKIQLHSSRVELAGILQDAIDAARPMIDEQRHTLVLQLPPPSLTLDGDPTRLAQVFMNLLLNAAKYMDAGGRIELTVDTSADEARVTLTDQGIGIAPGRLEKVFEMFSQEEAALSRSRGGLGIGLALTRRLIELHGGSIAALSEGVGHGSSFVVRLPLAGPAAPAAMALPEGSGQAARPVRPLRILVADDNQDAADALAELLGALGHSVHRVYDGEAAVEAARLVDPELVLLDIGMPRLNGYEACEAIRALGTRSLAQMWAITGWGQAQDMRRAREAGFDHHLVKPVSPDTLIGMLADVGPARGRHRAE